VGLSEELHDPLRAPLRMRAPQLTHQRLDLRRRLMRTRPRPLRTIRQTGETAIAIPGQPRVHRLARHTHSTATSLTLAPSNTAITALYRCSTTDNATNANPGLPPKSERADHDQRRQACPATHMSSISRDRTRSRIGVR
jgi:hypothetical protein